MSHVADPIDFEYPPPAKIPAYLEKVYWWAYVHPQAVRLFERQWLVNVILWGNFAKLRDAALDALGQSLPGRTLQVACVYGDFSTRLAARVAPGGTLDVIDVLPIQLTNLREKLPPGAPVTPMLRDSADLGFPAASYDNTVLFFLLHEQPEAVRRKTLSEAVRVTKPGGKIVIVDYHLPQRSQPLRYLFVEHLVLPGSVHFVAVVAGKIAGVVLAAFPQAARAALVAGKAHGALRVGA